LGQITTRNPPHTFPKEDRLCSKKDIETLFKVGDTIFSFPFKIFLHLQEKENSSKIQLLISVPKRHFKKAVDRNRIKRIIKESYRNNKDKLFVLPNNKSLHIAFLYVHKEIINFQQTDKKLLQSVEKINSILSKN
jgi:ribonuclease P protein component